MREQDRAPSPSRAVGLPEQGRTPPPDTLSGGGPNDFVGLLSVDGRLLAVSRMIGGTTRSRSAWAVGQPLWEEAWRSWGGAGPGRVREAVRRAAAGEVMHYEALVRVADGQLLTVELSLVPLIEAGSVRAVVVSAVDVTQRQEGEDCVVALADLTRRLAGATTVREVVTTMDAAGRAILHATRCEVGLWDRERDLLVIPGSSIDTSGDIGDTTECGRVTVGDCALTAPLRNARGETFAVLDLEWPAGAGLSAAGISHLKAMLEVCGPVLQRAIGHDAQDTLLRALRHELLPPMPAVAGLDLSARYLPASDQQAFGGDWYDAIRLGPTATAVVVGDVVGHGVHAAARMTRVRGVLNTLIQLEPDPASVFTRADDLLACLQDPFIGTAAVFVIDTATDVLTFASAGHPPALLRTPDGQVTVLADGLAPALGLPPKRIRPGRVPFGSGSTLLAYTDGLIEQPGQDLDTGIRTIADLLDGALFACAPSAAQILDRALQTTTVDMHRRDDVAAVVLHRV